MDFETQLKLQAWLDGELPEHERPAVEAWLAKDAEARALLEELRLTSGALAGFEAELRHPESREFFWSKIQREIARPARQTEEHETNSWLARWRRLLLPAGALAGLVLAGLLALNRGTAPGGPDFESAFADSGHFTYHDDGSGTTFVWFAYPAEEELADPDVDPTIE